MGKMRRLVRPLNPRLRQMGKVAGTEHTWSLNSRFGSRKHSLSYLPRTSSSVSLLLSSVSLLRRTIATGFKQSTATDAANDFTESPADASEKGHPTSLQEKVRHTMRRVPHPVMVITAWDRVGKLTGLLVSSFNTVTLDPVPVVSFNLRLPSSTYDAIALSGHFTVTGISNAKIADLFAKGRGIDKHAIYEKPIDSVIGSELDIKDGLFQIRCQWLKEKSVEIGDHVIMIGRVLDVTDNKYRTNHTEPLIYSQGRYRYAGPSIPISKVASHDPRKLPANSFSSKASNV